VGRGGGDESKYDRLCIQRASRHRKRREKWNAFTALEAGFADNGQPKGHGRLFFSRGSCTASGKLKTRCGRKKRLSGTAPARGALEEKARGSIRPSRRSSQRIQTRREASRFGTRKHADRARKKIFRVRSPWDGKVVEWKKVGKEMMVPDNAKVSERK